MTHNTDEQIAAFIEGNLRGAEFVRVNSHFARCEQCREVLHGTEETLAAMRVTNTRETSVFCRDCRFFRWDGHGTPACSTRKRDKHHLGIPILHAAENAREDPKDCGPEGRWYERRAAVPPRNRIVSGVVWAAVVLIAIFLIWLVNR